MTSFFGVVQNRDKAHRDVLQVQVLVVHRLTQLADLLLDLGHLLGGELVLLVLLGRRLHGDQLIHLKQLDHQLQAGPVQVHVQPVPAQDVHQGGGAQRQVLYGPYGRVNEGWFSTGCSADTQGSGVGLCDMTEISYPDI